MKKVEVMNISEFLGILESYRAQFSKSSCNDFIFRGIANHEWELLPKVLRSYQKPQKTEDNSSSTLRKRIYRGSENEMLWHFKKEASGIAPHLLSNDDLLWLLYAQHYGVPTRLLDFSGNPLVALYFACSNEREKTKNGVVWLLNMSSFAAWAQDEPFSKELYPDFTREQVISSMMDTLKKEPSLREDKTKKQRPILYIPPYIDQRMQAQQSRFLLWGDNPRALEQMTSEDNLMYFQHGIRLEIIDEQRFLAKVVIAENAKKVILRELDLLGINEKVLFPGLDSIGRYVDEYYRDTTEKHDETILKKKPYSNSIND